MAEFIDVGNKRLLQKSIVTGETIGERIESIRKQEEKTLPAEERKDFFQIRDDILSKDFATLNLSELRQILEKPGELEVYAPIVLSIIGEKRIVEERQKREEEERRKKEEIKPEPEIRPTELETRESLREQFGRPLREQFEKLFPIVEEAAKERVKRQFVPLRQQLAAQEAALGRFRSPIAVRGEERLAGEEALALSDILGKASAQRLTGEFDIAKTIENILSGEKEAGRRGEEFRKLFGLQREEFEEKKGRFRTEFEEEKISKNIERQLARLLGQQQAKTQQQLLASQQPDFLDVLQSFIPKPQIDFTFQKNI